MFIDLLPVSGQEFPPHLQWGLGPTCLTQAAGIAQVRCSVESQGRVLMCPPEPWKVDQAQAAVLCTQVCDFCLFSSHSGANPPALVPLQTSPGACVISISTGCLPLRWH